MSESVPAQFTAEAPSPERGKKNGEKEGKQETKNWVCGKDNGMHF